MILVPDDVQEAIKRFRLRYNFAENRQDEYVSLTPLDASRLLDFLEELGVLS
jgi:hypothetical protein